MFERVTAGILAGAVGTVAIDVVSTLDMAVRGRPSSPLPADLAYGAGTVSSFEELRH
jgi:hypothetical protein